MGGEKIREHHGTQTEDYYAPCHYGYYMISSQLFNPPASRLVTPNTN